MKKKKNKEKIIIVLTFAITYGTCKKRHLNNYSVHMKFYCNDISVPDGMVRLHRNFHLPSD